jgi:hypothetical protein
MDIYAVTSQDILDRISRHCPESLSVYLQCVNRASQDGTVFFTKENIEVDLSDKFGKFRNRIKKLALENLLEWHPFNGGIAVTLADLNHDG